MGVIDRSMAFITQLALEATPADEGGIRIGFTAKLPIGFGELPLDWLAPSPSEGGCSWSSSCSSSFWSCSRAVCSMALSIAGSSGLTELREAFAFTKLANFPCLLGLSKLVVPLFAFLI
jgi:hypothetical protein